MTRRARRINRRITCLFRFIGPAGLVFSANSTFNGVTAAEVVGHAGTITLKNVTINPAGTVRSRSRVGQPAAPPPAARKG